MIRYLGNRLVDGAVALALLTLIFEGPTITAILREKIGGRR